MFHALHEHPTGYILYRVKDMDEIGIKELGESLGRLGEFNTRVSFDGILSFSTAAEAIAQMEAVAEGRITKELKEFLEMKEVRKLAADKSYKHSLKPLGISPTAEEVAEEVLRALRKHTPRIIKQEEAEQHKTELSLSYTYSRKKIRYDVKKEDNSVMQSIALIDQLDLDINDYFMKVREMYSWHFPELARLVPDMAQYLDSVAVIGRRSAGHSAAKTKAKTTTKAKEKTLEGGEEITEAMKTTIGGDITSADMENILSLVCIVKEKMAVREKAYEHLHNKMETVSPNLSALIGDIVAARLILHAGGLSRLASYPSSTIQVLGAEKALFRALKTKGKTPKYGLLFNSTFISKSAPRMKGRVSRCLSSKCAIASRIDCYGEETTNKYGVALRGMVEERMRGMKGAAAENTDTVLARVYRELKGKK